MATATPASTETCGSNPYAEGWKVENSDGFGCGIPGKRGQSDGVERLEPWAQLPCWAAACQAQPRSLWGQWAREHPTPARPSPSSKQLISCSANADLSPPGATAHPACTASLSQLQLVPISACEEGQSPACCGDGLPRQCPACILLPRQVDFVLANGIKKCVEGPLELVAAVLCLKVCSPLTGNGLHADLLDGAALASLTRRMERGGEEDARAMRESEL